MKLRSFGWILAASLLASGIANLAHGDVILLGTDYLETTAPTTVGGVPFVGVPTGPGNTDTIVHRLMNTGDLSGGPQTINTEMVALSLMSAVPTNFGLGVGFYFVTLQSARGGPATLGNMTITQLSPNDNLPGTPEGSFSSFFDVFFDIRLGGLSGPIALSGNTPLTSTGSLWDATPPPGHVIVPGPVGDQNANLHTGKSATQMDFFPIAITEQEPGPPPTIHSVIPATTTAVPEPPTWILLVMALAGLAAFRLRQKA